MEGKEILILVIILVVVVLLISMSSGDEITNILNINTSNNSYINIYNDTSNTAHTIVLCGVECYTNITGLIVAENKNFNYSEPEIIVTVQGIYKIDWSVSFTGVANSQYGCGIALNQDTDNSRNCYARRNTGSNAVGNMGGVCILNLSIGDSLLMQIDDEANPVGNPTIYTASVAIIRYE